MIGNDELVVRLACVDGRIRSLSVAGRALPVPRLLAGQPAATVPALVGRLFSLCGIAQRHVAERAIASAEGSTPSDEADASLAVWREARREHLWQILAHWPRLLGGEPDPDLLVRLRPGHGDLEETIRLALGSFTEADTPAKLRLWAAGSSDVAALALARLLAGPPTPAPTLLPSPPSQEFLAEIDARLAEDEGFAARPLWRGAIPETGPLARRIGHPLLQALADEAAPANALRFTARLLELADPKPPGKPWLGSPFPGVAWAETARGLLIHRAEVEDGRIRRYAILAPTEWNFHTEGALKTLIAQEADGPAQACELATLCIAALDPCVGFRVEVA